MSSLKNIDLDRKSVAIKHFSQWIYVSKIESDQFTMLYPELKVRIKIHFSIITIFVTIN